MSVFWEDVSSFSRSDLERVPSRFRVWMAGVPMTVHRHIHHEKTDWLLTFEPFYNCKVISNGSAEDARKIAEKLVKNKIEELLAKFN